MTFLKKLTIAALALLIFSGRTWAECVLISGATQNINVGKNLTAGLTIPQDAPIGSVVYEEVTPHRPMYSFNCDGPFPVGFLLNPTLGSVAAGSKLFPLGKTGLSFRLFSIEDNLYYSSVRTNAKGLWHVGDETMRFEIIKSGNLASQTTFPSGYLGKQVADTLVAMNLSLVNPIILNAASCQTPAVSIQMGDDYRLDEFSRAGDTPRIIKFNIGLNQCQSGITKVTYSLQGTSQTIDPQKGIVALNSSSTAKGIGLKLMGDTGQPIVLGTTYPFNGFSTTGTSFNIPLSAAYYRLPDSNLEAGTANASVTFTVNYL